jgi:hypothetical protein
MGLGRPNVNVVVIDGNKQTASPAVLVLTMHHAIYDATSVRHILADVQAVCKGQAKLGYHPFTPFIRYFEGVSSTHEEYWREELRDLEAISFPTLPSTAYRPMPSSVIHYSVEICSRKKATNVTISTKIQVAWALVQCQYQQSKDVVFGVTVSGRAAPVSGMEKVAGPTIAT